MSYVLALLVLFACDDDDQRAPGTTPSAASPSGAVSPTTLFPLSPGDRWRIEGDDGVVRLEGVTGVDEAGVAVVHGTAHVQPERYRANGDGISLVDADGARLSPVLSPPITVGSRFDYALTEREVRVSCEVEIGSVDARFRIGARSFEPCVALTRRCRYPAGAPFSTETTHTRDETYCVGIGLVSERGVFRPAPSPGALGADRSERVVGFRVAGGPAPADTGCARYILLPSDVAAACGPDVTAASDGDGSGAELPSGGCHYEYRHGVATLEAVVGAPEDEVPETALVTATAEGRAAWVQGPEGACETAERLAPLLASLLR